MADRSQPEPERAGRFSTGRRHFLKQSAALAAVSAMVPAMVRGAGFSREFGPPVETTSGRIRGFVTGGIHSFRGIPYGASTAGPARFRPPAPPTPWTGVLDALGWGATAPQGNSTRDRALSANAYALAESDVNLQSFESEDCLAINVWTPSVDDGARRPVMVWLHGGGFWSGSASRAPHDGANLSRYGDVVVVSCNHRLNAAGYTYLGDADFAGSGNAGMLDLVLALCWVRDNIVQFGGDPANVTLFGYSGGGQKISTLMAMPQAQGLFHKAIIQSGQTPSLLGQDEAADVTRRLCARLGVAPGDGLALQAVDIDDLLAAYRAVIAEPPAQIWGFPARFTPVVDNAVLPWQPLEPEALALSADIPVMIGNTRQEMAGISLSRDPAADRLGFDDLPGRLRDHLGSHTEAVLAGYRELYPAGSPWDLYTLITADMPTRINSIRIAERRHALGRAPVFMYRVDWQTPVFGGRMKAPHGLEVPLVFRNVREASGINGGGDDAIALSETMSAAWVAFARHGRPDTPALGWPAYDPATRSTMLFDRECRVERDPDAGARRLLERAGPQLGG